MERDRVERDRVERDRVALICNVASHELTFRTVEQRLNQNVAASSTAHLLYSKF